MNEILYHSHSLVLLAFLSFFYVIILFHYFTFLTHLVGILKKMIEIEVCVCVCVTQRGRRGKREREHACMQEREGAEREGAGALMVAC